jgi:hypothetical protein
MLCWKAAGFSFAFAKCCIIRVWIIEQFHDCISKCGMIIVETEGWDRGRRMQVSIDGVQRNSIDHQNETLKLGVRWKCDAVHRDFVACKENPISPT